jgi:DNA-binding response OmpR family regulator
VADEGSVLVVEDDHDLRELVAEFLADCGYDVETAADGAEGLAAIDRAPPALVLLDMRMPGLDGRGFARGLRERGLATPIVVMTAEPYASWAEEVGAVGRLVKPFDLRQLQATVARLRTV